MVDIEGMICTGWKLWHWCYQNMHVPGLILTWVDPGMSVCAIVDLSFNIKNEILPHTAHIILGIC